MAIEVYIVAGEENTGKSRVIHHLTGLHRATITKLATTAGNYITVYVEISSLQEKEMTPSDFIARINKKLKTSQKFSAIVVALRTDNKAKIPTLADVYINAFKQAGWNIKFVAELNNGSVLLQHSQSNGYPYQTFQRANATNQLASQVRSFFQFI